MDRFEEMRTFVKVVEAGSLSAAADRLDIAKSAVSRRLADLESRLGVQLLNRTTRRLNLTDSGSLFYQRCQRILADLEESEQYVSSEHTNLRGTIRIAAPLTFGIHHLSPLFDEFLKEHPALRLDLDLNDRTVNLMDEGVDLGIRIGQLQDSSMMARKLTSAKMILCASPEYLEKHGEPKTPGDLKKHYGLNYSNLSERELWQFTHEDGKHYSVPVPFRMRSNNGDVLNRAALDSLGVVATMSFICYRELEQGSLRQILSEYKMEEVGIYAVYPAQRHLPGRVRLLIDYLVEQFGDEPYWDRFFKL
ncbi:MAG: LysR family transcriptional regulator [Chromatiales bacterium]|nr:LysR family transcriptional regulator [Chromatiales bacterium]